MSTELDDLSAVRIIYDALIQLDNPTRERVLRWVDEKLNSGGVTTGKAPATRIVGSTLTKKPGRPKGSTNKAKPNPTEEKVETTSTGVSDGLRVFLQEFAPKTANQIIAATASYVKQSSETAYRKFVEVSDIENAYIALGKTPPTYINQLLVTAKNSGYMKSGERGKYSITTLGEEMLLEFQRSKVS